MKKTKTLHRHIHPIHWHGSMCLAVTAILLATLKTGGELSHSLQNHHAAEFTGSVISNTVQREAEKLHLPVILSSGIRNATFSGK